MTMYNKENNPYRHIDNMLKAAFVKSFQVMQRTYTIVYSRVKVMLAHAYSIGKSIGQRINNNTQALSDIYCKCKVCQCYNGLLRTKEQNRQK